ncbi:hypothetical protein SAMN04487996_111303 [Dyadobacter soli]|uniref:Uncharacterized protein n=1 Tax=Dyadobacter soli TaxID=659014 RepID=A0A1G7MM93_9BACT|nr:hypothetical protein [Dyadobacter soli]SDF62250.1 hypothetical protein SAMN04487996_111303 [Dyadobacter soli]
MKSILSLISLIFLPALAVAQPVRTIYVDRDQVALAVTLLLVVFVLGFLLELTNRYFRYRIKEKILESAVTDELAALILQPDHKEKLRSCVKWLAIWLGLALGLAAVALTGAADWAAVAIICLCLSGSFLGYYIFLKRTDH